MTTDDQNSETDIFDILFIFNLIIGHIPIRDYCKIRLVCKSWNENILAVLGNKHHWFYLYKFYETSDASITICTVQLYQLRIIELEKALIRHRTIPYFSSDLIIKYVHNTFKPEKYIHGLGDSSEFTNVEIVAFLVARARFAIKYHNAIYRAAKQVAKNQPNYHYALYEYFTAWVPIPSKWPWLV
jgi:hypothetical protein